MLQGSVGTSWHQKNPSFHFVLFTVFSSYELHQYRVFLIIQLNCIDGEILKLLQIFLVTVPHFSGCCCRISFPGNCFSAVLMLQLQHKSTVFPSNMGKYGYFCSGTFYLVFDNISILLGVKWNQCFQIQTQSCKWYFSIWLTAVPIPAHTTVKPLRAPLCSSCTGEPETKSVSSTLSVKKGGKTSSTHLSCQPSSVLYKMLKSWTLETEHPNTCNLDFPMQGDANSCFSDVSSSHSCVGKFPITARWSCRATGPVCKHKEYSPSEQPK